jgi:serpin B
MESAHPLHPIVEKILSPVIRFRNLYIGIIIMLWQSVAGMAQPGIVENNNAFALDFYLQSRKTADGNIVFSPFSISAGLGMIYSGARNATADQIKIAMRFDDDPARQNSEFHTLLTNLTAAPGPMSITNLLWMQKGFTIQKRFLDMNTRHFGSTFHEVNFADAADSSRIAINALVEKQTRGKIKNLLSPGSINARTRLVLTNAIHFKDSWATPFDPEKTKDRNFFVSPGGPVTAKFMELQNVIFNFFENDVVTIAELPYHHSRFSMLVLLPKGDAADLEKTLTVTAYDSWNFVPGRFRTLQLPRFKIEHDMQPVDILRHFGMTDAFQEGKADFTGISTDARIFISGIFHKAFIEVNEKGTEAAAATAVVIQAESMIVPKKELDFVANKPFLFILRDRITNSILFIGKVNDPTH